MKKMMTMLLIMLPCISFAEIDELDFRNQMLDKEIENYTKIRDEKYEALKQCEKTTKGFKIAGITTLVATGVGVIADIKLSQNLNGKTSRGSDKSARVVNNKPQEEKNEDSCVVLCDAGIGESAGCTC